MPPRFKPQNRHVEKAPVAERLVGRLEEFTHYLQAECGMSDNTVKAYTRDVRQFFDWMKRESITDLKSLNLKRLSAYLRVLHEQGLKASSISRKLVAIKTLMRYLLLEGLITESEAELLNSPKLWQYLPKVLSPNKVEDLLGAPRPADDFYLRDRALLCLMYATGCRATEVATLELKDVALEERTCKCTGKGNKERIVSLNPVAVAALEAYIQHERPGLTGVRGEASLFLSRTGRGLTRLTVWRIVKKYAARVGCSEQVSPHTLRHSFATHMLAGGAEIRALQEMLGHANIRTTQVYTHVEHSRLKSIHQACHPRG